MAVLEQFISRLREEKVKAAVEGLARPQQRDAFELGRLSGIQQGLTLADKILQEVLNEDESAENTGKRIRTRSGEGF